MSNPGERYISVDFTGTLVCDPKMITLPNGMAVCEFDLENEEWEHQQYVLLYGINSERIICKWAEAIQRALSAASSDCALTSHPSFAECSQSSYFITILSTFHPSGATMAKSMFSREVALKLEGEINAFQACRSLSKRARHINTERKVKEAKGANPAEELPNSSASAMLDFAEGRIALLPENKKRPTQIKQIAAARGISTLFHFTPVERLRSILHRGLLSRHCLEKLPPSKQPEFTDPYRYDGHKEGICLSISFPNDQMLFSRTGYYKKSEWVILLIDTKVLWELDCAFCYQNASSDLVRCIPLKDKKKPAALEKMFKDSGFDNKGSYQRQQIPKCYPTHPQAEVLVFNPIPPTYIRTVHFYNDIALQKWTEDNPGLYTQNFLAEEQYFKRRCDYKAWQSDNRNPA